MIRSSLLLFNLALLAASLQLMTLQECDRLGLQYCYTGASPNRQAINAAIEGSAQLKAKFEFDLRPSAAEVVQEISALQSSRFKRTSRQEVPTEEERTDCDSVCCSVISTTPPFSFLRDKDGWSQVASTPEYPQRTVFRTERCFREGEKCKNVSSTRTGYYAKCVEAKRMHYIYFFNNTGPAPTINRREITLPAGCRCQLVSAYDSNNNRNLEPDD